MYKSPQELIRDKLSTNYPALASLEPTLLVHLSLQRMYILETDVAKRNQIMLELMLMDERMKGYFIGVGAFHILTAWFDIVDFGLGHTKEDLKKWEEQFGNSEDHKN